MGGSAESLRGHPAFGESSMTTVLNEGPDREILECERELLRVRVELAELKRIGSRQGLPELTCEATRLSMRIGRLKSEP